jgi:hypothetical protein
MVLAIAFVAMVSDGSSVLASQPSPVVFRVSEGVAPGGIVSLYGEDLTGDLQVRVAETGTVVKPVQQDAAGQFARFVMPESAPGVYTLRVSNDGGKTWASKSICLNGPTPRWLSEETAYPRMRLQLIGRNLDAAEYHGISKTEVRLLGADGRVARMVAPDRVTPYCTGFVVPQDLPLGSYYVEVRTNSAGLGREFVRLIDEEGKDARLTIVAAPEDALPRELGVAWANDFNWKNVVNVKTQFGAKGDGKTDDTATIQSALEHATKMGGGVVFIPKGTYRFTGLRLDKGVVLKGEDNAKSVLQFTLNSPRLDGTEYMVFQSVGLGHTQGLIGFAHLGIEFDPGLNPDVRVRLFNLGDSAWPMDLRRLSASRIFLYGNRIDIPFISTKWAGMYINGAGPVLIAKNHWKASSPAWSHGIKRNLVCRDNTFEFANEQVSFSSDRMIFENNVMIGHFVPGITSSLHGLFTESWCGYNVWNEYIAGNTCRNMNYVPGNDGEAFALDSPGFYIIGDVLKATGSTVEFREDSVAKSGSIGWNLEWQAVVIKGRGLGQLRRVRQHLDQDGKPKIHQLTVAPAWDIPPDGTSKIAVVRMHTGVVLENNTVTDCCGPTVQFYHCAYDCVASGNIGVNTMGVINYGGYWGNPNTLGQDRSAMMTYFTKVRGCGVSGASARFKNTWMGERGEDTLAASGSYATCLYGSEYRDNVVDRRGCEALFDYDNKNPAGFCVTLVTGQSNGRSILAPLFENCAVQNSKYGYAVNCSACTATLISGPRIVGITSDAIFDKGKETKVLGSHPSARRD